eukprot:CAMPEP_0177411576 /NCGR_PEP_ID=MMETSP0368-20130122/65495_1 /TAXON_ID=447022 ORGANISM="Scrippsiella hangoei-like, Strain SHHI-4" /NCGR_SAMPLE_ID=MMETSP0368 /ASSEMBLY_ACC=CAM_ASM_000363 /LENGTH=44 /DNA_ID= /DNA_START= /DNA_END= /DNA_ORIENTATION=
MSGPLRAQRKRRAPIRSAGRPRPVEEKNLLPMSALPQAASTALQ